MPYILSSPSNHIDRKITENKTLILWQHIEQDFNTYYIIIFVDVNQTIDLK